MILAVFALAIFLAAKGQEESASAQDNPALTDQEPGSGPDGSGPDLGELEGDIPPDGSLEGDIGPGGSLEGGALGGIGDKENVAAENRLSSVRILTQDTDDDEEEFVRFCFRNEVQDLDEGKAASFAVMGPDPELGESASAVKLDEARKSCVIAGFESGVDVRSYTLGAVEGGAVENREDEKNIADSAPLSGARTLSTRGRTTGPDLVAIRVSKTLNRAQYIFDEELEEDAGGDASGFGFYTERGEARTASKLVSIEDKVATVEFGEKDQVDESERKFVKAGAVRDRGGSENPMWSTRGRTSNPDLVSVSRSSADTQYDYTFDEDVTDVQPEEFVLYTDNGEEIAGESYSKEGRKVRVTFPRETEDYPGDIVLAAVAPDAATANERDSEDSGSGESADGNGQEVTLGALGIGSNPTRSGRTTGPDLIGLSTDADGERLTLTFDEVVDDETDDYDASGVYIATNDDELVAADRILEIEGRRVYVQADENDLESLVGVTLESGAIADFQGNTNPINTVARGSADRDGTSGALYSRVK